MSTSSGLPQTYDPQLLYQWLWYKHRCHECTPTEFQKLVEEILQRSDPDFMSIRPYGRIGDRKCDGLLFASGTVFQVYSPDSLSQTKLLRKINEDLDGAVSHWKTDLKRWVFVYNVRRGIPPDVPHLLMRKSGDHPHIQIDHMSSDGLWEIAKSLTPQQRAEVLPPPPSLDCSVGLSGTDKAEERRRSRPWLAIVQDVLSPISTDSIRDALAPDTVFGQPFYLTLEPNPNALPWEEEAVVQRLRVEAIIRNSRGAVGRFAVFSLAPIPLAVHLGFVLSDRLETRCYQFDRDGKSWRWPSNKDEAAPALSTTGLPSSASDETVDVVIRISLSDHILPDDTEVVTPHCCMAVDIVCESPDVDWLRHPSQLTTLGTTFRDVLASIRQMRPNCRRIHLFYAGPTGGAVVVGQQVNPRMNPPVFMYEYSRRSSPRYQFALMLGEQE